MLLDGVKAGVYSKVSNLLTSSPMERPRAAAAASSRTAVRESCLNSVRGSMLSQRSGGACGRVVGREVASVEVVCEGCANVKNP